MTAYYIFIREKLFHPRRDAHFQSIIKTVYDPWYFISFEDKFELIDSSDVCRCIMYMYIVLLESSTRTGQEWRIP